MVRISVSQKTGARHRGSIQTLPRGTAQQKTTEKYFEISLQRTRPDAPEAVTVEHLTVIEGAKGKLRAGKKVEESAILPLGRAVKIETEPVSLSTVKWSGGPRGTGGAGETGESVYGYIVRVRAPDGTLLGEKIQPRGLEGRADEFMKEAERMEKRKARADRLNLPPPKSR